MARRPPNIVKNEIVDSGYIRSVIYYFKKGDSFEQCGGNHVKAYVEHYFTSDTNMTYDYFKLFLQTSLAQNSGHLSEFFKIAPSPNLQMNHTCSSNSMARLKIRHR